MIRYVLPVLIDDVMFAQSANVTLRHNVAFPVVFAARSFCTTSLHLPCESLEACCLTSSHRQNMHLVFVFFICSVAILFVFCEIVFQTITIYNEDYVRYVCHSVCMYDLRQKIVACRRQLTNYHDTCQNLIPRLTSGYMPLSRHKTERHSAVFVSFGFGLVCHCHRWGTEMFVM